MASQAQEQPCPAPPTHKIAATLATLKVGDYWIYTQNGMLTPPPAGAATAAAAPAAAGPPSSAAGAPSGPLPLTGTFVEKVELRTFQGQPTLALVVVQNLTSNGVSIYGTNPAPEQIFYVEQDPTTKDVLVLGDNAGPGGTDEAATTPAVFYLGSWALGASYNDTLSFPSGSQTGLYLNVTGTTTIQTHIGNFEAWVAPNGATLPTGAALDTGIDYWSPELGAPVAFSTVTNLPDGSVRTLDATLIKSSRVKPLYPVLAKNLNQPRGVAFDPSNNLWFTEAGAGGPTTGLCIPFMGTENCFGNTGKVSALVGEQRFVVNGNLGSLATPLKDQVTGPTGIAFNSDGTPYVLLGDGGPQATTSLLGADQNRLGILVHETFTPSGAKAVPVASLANYEYANDPDDRPNPDGTLTPDSNPYGLTSIGENLYVADGGAHTVNQVTPAGAISVIGVMPNQQVDMPAFPGGPVPSTVDSVPTGIMPAPDGQSLLVADYTGYPYFPGTSRIWQFQAGQAPTVFASGFTNLIGLSPDLAGGVYALEMTSNGANSGDPGGAVIHIDPTGAQTVLACQGLIMPTGMATGPDGNLYISNYGLNSGFGEIIQVSTH